MTLTNDESLEDVDAYIERLRVGFLFPDLDEGEKYILLALSSVHRALQYSISCLALHRDKMNPHVLLEREQSACSIEGFFMFCKEEYQFLSRANWRRYNKKL